MTKEEYKILVVDDDPNEVETIKVILESEGYKVKTAGNGKIALEKVELEKPNLIVLDVMMPELDGFATCSKLKSSPEYKDIPIILLTAVGMQISETKYPLDGVMRTDAEEYLEKPTKPQELLKVVAKMLK